MEVRFAQLVQLEFQVVVFGGVSLGEVSQIFKSLFQTVIDFIFCLVVAQVRGVLGNFIQESELEVVVGEQEGVVL